MCETTIYSPVLPLKASHDTKVDQRWEERVIVQQEFAFQEQIAFLGIPNAIYFYFSVMGFFKRLLTLLLFKLLNNHGIIFISKKDSESCAGAGLME